MCQRLFSATWAEFKLPAWNLLMPDQQGHTAASQSTNLNLVIWVQGLPVRLWPGLSSLDTVTVQVACLAFTMSCHQGQGSCEARPWLPEHQLECRSDLSAGLEPAIETGHWHRPGISCLGPVTVQVASWHSESPRACQGGYGQASAALAQPGLALATRAPTWI